MDNTSNVRGSPMKTQSRAAIGSTLAIALLTASIPVAAVGGIPSVCDHLLDFRLVGSSAVVEADQKTLYAAGDFLLDSEEPTLRIAGEALGDPWGRHILVVVNGKPIGVEDNRAPWYVQSDPDDCQSFQYHTATVGSSFELFLDLSDVLNPTERVLPVDVLVGVSTYVGSWTLEVESV